MPIAASISREVRYKLSKESAAKTLSFLFQDNFSGRAEIGLTGDDDFHFKVSADGTTWADAIIIDRSTGSTKVNTGFFLTGDLSPSQVTADQNDYNPTGLSTASVLRLSSDASRNITGLSGGGDGRVIAIVNVGANPVTLRDENSSSAAANRFALGADFLLNAKQGAVLWYDSTDSRWKLLGARVPARELLAANRTYYVATTGSDSNSGLSSGAAFATIQKAYDTIAAKLDLAGFTVTIQLADGTYTAGLAIAKPWTGGGAITIQGNNGTPANVLVSTSGDCLNVSCLLPNILTIKDLKVVSSAGSGIFHSGVGTINFQNVNFGACAVYQFIALGGSATIVATGNYAISGGAVYHMFGGAGGSVFVEGLTITLTGTPAFSGAFAIAKSLGAIVADGNTYSGSATGTRYSVTLNGIINTAGGGANYFPGNSAGATATGGQYA